MEPIRDDRVVQVQYPKRAFATTELHQNRMQLNCAMLTAEDSASN